MENKIQPKGSAQLSINGETYDLPVYGGSIGPDVIDIRALYKNAGVFTFDPGFTSTASCESQITYIDGDEGTLLYRGYPIDQLADNASFIEVAYLLQNGELPNAKELEEFDWTIRRHTMVHEQMTGSSPASAVTPTRWRSCVGTSARCRRSITTQPTSPIRRPAHGRLDADDRKDADHCRDGVQVSHRPALRVSEERSRLRVELPAHVLCGALRGIRSQPGPWRAPWTDLHPARRPRAERIDLDRASGRLVGRQPVRLHRGRHRLPVGPGSWRRQRSGAQHAGGNRFGRQHPRIRRRPRTRTIRSA
jgi:hypothetical protein